MGGCRGNTLNTYLGEFIYKVRVGHVNEEIEVAEKICTQEGLMNIS